MYRFFDICPALYLLYTIYVTDSLKTLEKQEDHTTKVSNFILTFRRKNGAILRSNFKAKLTLTVYALATCGLRNYQLSPNLCRRMKELK